MSDEESLSGQSVVNEFDFRRHFQAKEKPKTQVRKLRNRSIQLKEHDNTQSKRGRYSVDSSDLTPGSFVEPAALSGGHHVPTAYDGGISSDINFDTNLPPLAMDENAFQAFLQASPQAPYPVHPPLAYQICPPSLNSASYRAMEAPMGNMSNNPNSLSMPQGIIANMPPPSVPNMAQPSVTFQGRSLEELRIPTTRYLDRGVQELILRAFERPLVEPPVLPDNTVEELEPKQVFPDYIRLPDHAPEPQRLMAEEINNNIAADSQRIDRERNNDAAKRSRRIKNENLDNAFKLIVNQTMENSWLRANVIALGGNPDMYRLLDPSFTQRYRSMINRGRVEASEQRRRSRSRSETRKRSQQHKARVQRKRELNARAARQCADVAYIDTVPEMQITFSPVNPRAARTAVSSTNAASAGLPNMDDFGYDPVQPFANGKMEAIAGRVGVDEYVEVAQEPDWDLLDDLGRSDAS